MFATITWRSGSKAALPQFTPPTLPGNASVPLRLGGVKMPSDREALTFSWHHWTSAGVGPQASFAAKPVGTSEIVGNGCVGELCSPGTSVWGTARSSTGKSGAPVRRFSTNTWPILVLMTTAGVPSFHVTSVGCAATS